MRPIRVWVDSAGAPRVMVLTEIMPGCPAWVFEGPDEVPDVWFVTAAQVVGVLDEVSKWLLLGATEGQIHRWGGVFDWRRVDAETVAARVEANLIGATRWALTAPELRGEEYEDWLARLLPSVQDLVYAVKGRKRK